MDRRAGGEGWWSPWLSWGAVSRISMKRPNSATWLLRLRALLAQAQGDEDAYRDYRDRYRAMAKSLGFEGHMKWAEAMT